MTPFEVVRTFGCWRGAKFDYRLVRLIGARGMSPFAIQYGQADLDKGAFHVVDAHRHDAESPIRDSAEVWAHEWMVNVYDASRLLNYEATMRAYESVAHAHRRFSDGFITRAHVQMVEHYLLDLRGRAGFDPLPDFPGLDRILDEWTRDTTTPNTTTPSTPVGGGSRMSTPLLGDHA